MKIWITLIISAFFLFSGYSFFLSPKGMVAQYQLKQSNKRLRQEIDSLKQHIKHTTETIERLQHDTLYIESVIRTKLGMTRPDEKAFRFVPPTPSEP